MRVFECFQEWRGARIYDHRHVALPRIIPTNHAIYLLIQPDLFWDGAVTFSQGLSDLKPLGGLNHLVQKRRGLSSLQSWEVHKKALVAELWSVIMRPDWIHP